MADICPSFGPGDPLVASLAASTDCRMQLLVRSSFDALLGPNAAFSGLITAGLTIYVALIGYRLMLGRGSTTVSDFALSALKIGVILALATQWSTYERVVYDVLVHGPTELADGVRRSADGPSDWTGALQHAFDDLTIFSPAAPPGPFHRDPNAAVSLPTSLPQAMSPAAFDSLLFQISAVLLLLTTLGTLLAAKITLGVLLGIGPLFIGLALFQSTRGLFVGWLRASLACAMLPLLGAGALTLALAVLTPSLGQIETMLDTDTYIPGVGTRVLVIVLVMALATAGLALAAMIVGASFRLSRSSPNASQRGGRPSGASQGEVFVTASRPATLGRADRIAASLTVQDRPRLSDSAGGRPGATTSPTASVRGSSDFDGRRTRVTLRR